MSTPIPLTPGVGYTPVNITSPGSPPVARHERAGKVTSIPMDLSAEPWPGAPELDPDNPSFFTPDYHAFLRRYYGAAPDPDAATQAAKLREADELKRNTNFAGWTNESLMECYYSLAEAFAKGGYEAQGLRGTPATHTGRPTVKEVLDLAATVPRGQGITAIRETRAPHIKPTPPTPPPPVQPAPPVATKPSGTTPPADQPTVPPQPSQSQPPMPIPTPIPTEPLRQVPADVLKIIHDLQEWDKIGPGRKRHIRRLRQWVESIEGYRVRE